MLKLLPVSPDDFDFESGVDPLFEFNANEISSKKDIYQILILIKGTIQNKYKMDVPLDEADIYTLIKNLPSDASRRIVVLYEELRDDVVFLINGDTQEDNAYVVTFKQESIAHGAMEWHT